MAELYVLPKAFDYAVCERVSAPDPPPATGWIRVSLAGYSVDEQLSQLLDLPAGDLVLVPPEPEAPAAQVGQTVFVRNADGFWCGDRWRWQWASVARYAVMEGYGQPKLLVYADGGR